MNTAAAVPPDRLSSARMDQPLFFLLSPPRSGSTLLTRILNSHSRVASPCEICLPYVVARSWKLHTSLRNMGKICRHYEVPMPVFRWSLIGRSTARSHLETTARTILQKEGKQTLVIKDPRHASHAQRIETLLQDRPPRYIFLHRDARNVAHSFHKTLGRNPERGFRVWSASTRAMQEFMAELPEERYIVARFEDVLADPEPQIGRLLRFMGLEFEREMLDYGRFEHADDRMNLWRNPNLVASVKKGSIQPTNGRSWEKNEAIIREYAARPDIQALNRAVGYLQTC